MSTCEHYDLQIFSDDGDREEKFSIHRLRKVLFYGCQGQDKFAYCEALTDKLLQVIVFYYFIVFKQ